MNEINWNPTRNQLRTFVVALVAAFAIAAIIVYRNTGSIAIAAAILAAGLIIALIGHFHEGLIRVMYIAWMLAVFPIGWMVSWLLLAGVYYLVVTPIGLTRRLLRRDTLGKRFDRSAETYWRRRSPPSAVDRYFQQH
jgi:hypothetical protein